MLFTNVCCKRKLERLGFFSSLIKVFLCCLVILSCVVCQLILSPVFIAAVDMGHRRGYV